MSVVGEALEGVAIAGGDLETGFVDQDGGLEVCGAAFAGEQAAGDALDFVEPPELVARGGVAGGGGGEEGGDLGWLRFHFETPDADLTGVYLRRV